MNPPIFAPRHRRRALQFAVLGNLVPIALATAADFDSHRTVFFVGAAIAMLAPIVVVLVPQGSPLRTTAAVGGLVALTMMQAYSGGVGSPYAVLLMMPAIWFGLQATQQELKLGLGALVICCYAPMLIFGAPAYPVDWIQATLVAVIVISVAGSLATVSRETWRLTEKLQREATIDDLTGLLNRRGWRYVADRELARARRHESPVALVIIDLDGLKEVNDSLGHDVGDELLRDTAKRMRDAFRVEDTVARCGGDEFFALLTDVGSREALDVVERLRAETPDRGSFSAGVAVSAGGEGLEELQRRADLALYESKAKGGRRSSMAVA